MKGRATKLNDELIETIVALIRSGNFPETAATACGVPRSTWYDWLRWGREGKEPYSHLSDAVTRARGEAVVGLLSELRQHAAKPKGGAHIQWLLEKLDRDRFGPQIRVQVANELERYLDIAERVLERDQFARLLQAWSDADAGEESVGTLECGQPGATH
jgi:hypothetical protein